MIRKPMTKFATTIACAAFATTALAEPPTKAAKNGPEVRQPANTRTSGETRTALKPNARQHQSYHMASKAMGMKVLDQKGNAFGKVNDLVVNNHGHVKYLAVQPMHASAAGDSAKGDILLVPYSALDWSEANSGDVIVQASKQELGKAPTFSRKRLADTNDTDWAQDVNRYFGVRADNPRERVRNRNRDQIDAVTPRTRRERSDDREQNPVKDRLRPGTLDNEN